ncbi:Cna B-type domain-containing protein, partial [Methanobrevibacter sp.]|uniref:Cna B-type domain-containing protein n=1 Tax=Methanobrevibacter sp. TaxID=66852 RepID=UPI0025E49F96
KVWTDNDNQDGVRNASVTIHLVKNNETVIATVVLNDTNNWRYVFEGLDKYQNNGTLINYTVTEDELENYTVKITGNNYEFIVNNTHVIELVNVTVVKVWTDNNNQDGVRPDNVTVNLIKNETVIRTAVLNDTNNWTFTFHDLDKYENYGTLIVYSINETEVINYTAEITGDNVSFVINNTHVIELINVTVVKVWNDGNNISGQRPANVTVVLLADGTAIKNTTLSVSNDWTYTFEGLDKFRHNGTLIKYSIDEVDVGVPGYTTNITNSTPYYWIVNNTYAPDVNKTANVSTVYYHEFVKFNITITNIGTGVYNETLTVIDSMPYGLDYIETVNITGARVIQEGVYDNATRNITWIITEIAPDTPAIITILVGAYDVGNLTNKVVLIGPNGYNKEVKEPVEVLPIVDVSVIKTVDLPEHFVGDVVVWTIKVSNAFNGTNATDVILNDVLPNQFNFINYTATKGTYVNGVWNIGFMGNGTEETLTIYTRARTNGTFTNYVNVTCNETEWNYTNNYDNATVKIIKTPPVKEVNNTKPFLHENVTYYLTVINNGDVDYVNNLTVVDSLPDGVDYIETLYITGADVVVDAIVSGNNVTWVITNISAGTTAVIAVKAQANAVGIKVNNETIIYPDGSSDKVNATIEVQPIVDVAVVKSVDRPVSFVGDVVVWTVKVSNAFNGSTATNVRLSELLPDQFTFLRYEATKGTYENDIWTIGTMGNGTEETLTIYTRARTNGTFTNYVNVTCNETEWNYTNNYDNATVKIIKTPPVKEVNNTKPFLHENVTYYLTVINNGDVDYVNNLTVVDSLPDGVDYIETLYITGADVVVDAIVSGNNVTWVITNISAGTTAVIAVKAQANAVGIKVNNETIIYPDGSSDKVNATIEVQPLVDVSVVKTADKDAYFVGDIVIWTIKVSNAANGSAATDVKLNEALPSQFAFVDYAATKGTYANDVWTIGTMGNGTEETLTLYTRALTDGTFTNYVNVTCNETESNYTNNYDNETVIVNRNPDINKTVNDTTPYTHTIVEYYLTVTNTVDVDYTNNLTVIDSLPEGLVYANDYKVDGADLVSFVADGQVIYWTITNISANSSAVITVKVLADATGNLTNNGTLVPPYGNNITVNCTITPVPRADLEIIKLVSKKVSHYNDRVTWTIIVKNNGPDTAVNAIMSDKLPADLVYVSDDSRGAYDPATGIWKLGDIAKGQSRELNIVSIVKVTNKTIVNFANVSSDTPDPNETNNRANNTTDVPPEADLMLIKNVDKANAKVGDNITFEIVVTNLGPDDAINSRAYDVLPDGLKFISCNVTMGSYDPETGIWTIGDLRKGDTVSLIIVAQALRTGHFVNEAYVVSDTYDPDLSNNNDTADVTVEDVPEPPEPPVTTLQKHPTGNPLVIVVLALLAIVGVTLRRKI